MKTEYYSNIDTNIIVNIITMIHKETNHYLIQYDITIEDELIIILEKIRPLVVTIKDMGTQLPPSKLADYLNDCYYYNVILNLYTNKHYFKNNSCIEEVYDGPNNNFGNRQYRYLVFNENNVIHNDVIIAWSDIKTFEPIIIYCGDDLRFNFEREDRPIKLDAYGREGEYNIYLAKEKQIITKKALNNNA